MMYGNSDFDWHEDENNQIRARAEVYQEEQQEETIRKLEAKVALLEKALVAQPAQRKPLTERELMKCITQAKCFDTVKMTYESGPYEIDRPTLKAFEFARAIEAAHGIKD